MNTFKTAQSVSGSPAPPHSCGGRIFAKANSDNMLSYRCENCGDVSKEELDRQRRGSVSET
jgi:hypothetical protein